MTLVDSNILMYTAGADDPHKAPSIAFAERVARREVSGIIDAETLQEILHRYRSIGRWQEGSRIYTLARKLFPEVLPVSAEILDHTRALMELYPRLKARDAVHAAIVQIHGLDSICSYDRDFDMIAGMLRIEPS